MIEGLSQEQKVKLISACLENIRSKEQSSLEKEKIESIIRKLPDTREISTLKGDQKITFELLYEGYQMFREAYIELSNRPENAKAIDEKLDINNYLLKLIPKVVLMKDKLNYEGIVSKIFVSLLTDIPKVSPKTTRDFIKIWKNLANEKLQQKSKKKQDDKMQETNVGKKEEPPKQPQEISEDEESQESSQQPPPPPPPPKIKQKSQQQKAREAREREKQKQREIERQKELQRRVKIQKEQDERKRMQQKRQREQNLKRSDKREIEARQIKGKSIQSYISQFRKDICFQKGKNRQISDFLAAKLDQFLKISLQQMYDIACLKNKKNPKFGNQLGYFSQQNNRIQNTQEFYFQPNTKIYSLSYPHKHDIYSQLRIKEIKKEDDLRYNLEIKTNQGDKKIEKKIENYILKPRPKDSDQILVPYREEKEGFRSQSITISIQHVIYFLETHPWLRNSLLLFEVYHRY